MVNGVIVGINNGVDAFEVRGSPHFEGPVPRSGIEKRTVVGQGQGRDRVHVMDPRAGLVAPDSDVVLCQEQGRETVAESGKSRYTFVVSMVVVVVVVVVDFPYTDFVVLMGSEEFITGNHHRLDGATGSSDQVFRRRRVVVIELIWVSGPETNTAVGGRAVEELSCKDEGGDVGGVGW